MKPTGAAIAARAVELATGPTISYSELDCQAFIEQCVSDCGGRMDYSGSNDMARNAVVWMGTIANAKAEGKLLPGAGLMINEEVSDSTPVQYRGDGLGDFSHVGLYVGDNALTDVDKQGRLRNCDVVHSSSSMGRVAGSTLQNGWTHVVWFRELDYGAEVQPGVQLGAEIAISDAEGAKAEAAGLEYAIVTAPSGGTVYLRPQPKKGGLYWSVGVNTRVSVERRKNGWALINAVCVDGVPRRAWMMEKFLEYEG